MKVSYTDLHTYGIINVEIKDRSSFMPLSMAVTVIRKLTTAHRYYVKIADTEPYRNRSQEMWKLGQKFSYAITYTASPIFIKVTPARQLYVNNFIANFMKICQSLLHTGQVDGWTWYPHDAFFILFRTEGRTNYVLNEGTTQGSQGPCSHKWKYYL